MGILCLHTNQSKRFIFRPINGGLKGTTCRNGGVSNAMSEYLRLVVWFCHSKLAGWIARVKMGDQCWVYAQRSDGGEISADDSKKVFGQHWVDANMWTLCRRERSVHIVANYIMDLENLEDPIFLHYFCWFRSFTWSDWARNNVFPMRSPPVH